MAFKKIKDAIVTAPVLVSPDYSKDFHIFSFASKDTIVGVLLQKNDQNMEQPIAFMSKALRDEELKYSTMEKQAYALVQSLKHFRSYKGEERMRSTLDQRERMPPAGLDQRERKLCQVLLERKERRIYFISHPISRRRGGKLGSAT